MSTAQTSPPLSDASDRLLLDEAAPLLAGTVVVVDAPTVAMRLRGEVAELRIFLDSASQRRQFIGRVFDRSLEDTLADADVVLLRLPKALDRLDDLAAQIARHAKPSVQLLASGRLKYMTLSMNAVLGRSFGGVRASLARQKSRVLFASSPLDVPAPAPTHNHLPDLQLDIVAWGGVFAGATLDIGTRAMLATYDSLPPFETAIDFGCGTGILAAELKRARPSARVIASDDSRIAIDSARDTFAANGLDIEVAHEATLSGQSDNSADLIVLNPPFHSGGPVERNLAQAMIILAARKLKPGGELRTVWNSHLGYGPVLRREVGPTRQVSRTPKFTVTASVRRP
ncbi:MAG TPA: methyltransferase [Galbitalea sp.]|jgi:16S rRNA (guanine1207-N2)-methyltransferase|nr:methyltransferase [Galbitalea sp.]